MSVKHRFGGCGSGLDSGRLCYTNRQKGGGKPHVEAPRRKPQRSCKLETRPDISKGESPRRTGLRDDSGFLAWVTGHSGCFLGSETSPKK